MQLADLRRHRVVIGLAALIVSFGLLSGLKRPEADGRVAVLDSPLGLITPRLLAPGWHLVPPGLLRLSLYPTRPETLTIATRNDREPLATSEGISVESEVTLRYQVAPEEVLRVHQELGPDYERGAVRQWVIDALRGDLATARYADISGARIEDLQSDLSRVLTDRFRAAGLALLSCEVRSVRILNADPHEVQVAGSGTGGSVLLIGLDGADWNVVDPLIKAGKLPNLARLSREGVRVRVRSISPMLSPVIWTSIATGVVPARHGILDFVSATEREGERVPVTSNQRQVKAIWNMLSESGVSVGLVGWWATYPAESVRGFVVSDRVAYQLFGARPIEEQERRGKVFPAEADAVVQSLTVTPESVTVQDLGRFMRLPADPSGLDQAQSKMVDDFKTLLASTRTYVACTQALGERYRTQFTAVYLEGTDTVAHLFMPYAPPPLEGTTPEQRQRFGQTVNEYYELADEQVGRLLHELKPATVIVVSDHGFRTGENRPLTESRIAYGGAADWHRKYGILILHGAAFKKGAVVDEASVLDITPTILRLFGLPVGEDMDGRPISEAFDEAFLRQHPERYIPTWESGATPAPSQVAQAEGPAPAPDGAGIPGDPEGDAERIEKLRSLGYVGTKETANTHNNRGTILLGDGRLDEALEEFRKAIAASEDLSIARLNMARAWYKKKNYDAATQEIQEHLKRQPRSKEAYDLLGNMAMDKGRYTEAEADFKRALTYEPQFADARNSLGVLYQKLGRQDEALEQFRRVVAVDPDYAEGYNNIGVILKDRGQLDEAASNFKRAIAADPEFSGSYSNLALVLEDRGDLDGAETQFRNALRRDTRNAAVRANLGGLLYTRGRFEEARQELEKATAIDASNASAWNNLGAALGRLGHPDEEIAAYRKAATLDPGYADVHHNLGLALLKQGEVADGDRELSKALELDPGYVPAYLNLARSLAAQSRENDALDILRRGMQKRPRDPDLRLLNGELLLRLGRTSDALSSFEESLRLKPDQPDLKQRIEEMQAAGGGGRPDRSDPVPPANPK